MCQTINPIELYRDVCGIAPAFVPRHVEHKSKAFGGRLLFPALQTPGELDVSYPVQQPINKDSLFLAQQFARFAGNCQTEQKRKAYMNQANFFMTGAYQGHEAAVNFWNQFWSESL